jgi:hypothetical protein
MFPNETWLLLLGLVRPLEYFVTVDNTSEWRRHLVWSKTHSAALREYVIQRFSSNMVFLSLMMSSTLSVLFNSSAVCDEMRRAIIDDQWQTFKFYIGITTIVTVGVNISAMVATFTAWGMVSSISDANVHCLLRSSIGQYVCHLPARLVAATLYIFLFWIFLWAIELTKGVTSFILSFLLLSLFFQVVIAFSAFGRLILHTGAMGEKPILESDFESALLPSGLHAYLFVKATQHQRGRSDRISKYKSSHHHQPESENMRVSNENKSQSPSSPISMPPATGNPNKVVSDESQALLSKCAMPRSDWKKLIQNWENDCDVRDLYDAPQVKYPTKEVNHTGDIESSDSMLSLAALLNRPQDSASLGTLCEKDLSEYLHASKQSTNFPSVGDYTNTSPGTLVHILSDIERGPPTETEPLIGRTSRRVAEGLSLTTPRDSANEKENKIQRNSKRKINVKGMPGETELAPFETV